MLSNDPIIAGSKRVSDWRAFRPQLEQEVAVGRFREDLLYRLNVFTIPLAPLHDRGDATVLLLAEPRGSR